MWKKPHSATPSTRLPAVDCGKSKPHNRPVANTPWQQRIRRADKLAEQHPFAAEILAFYMHVAGFQQRLSQRLQSIFVSPSVSAGQTPVLLSDQPEFPELLNSFPQFLSLVEEKAPVSFAQTAREVRNSEAADRSELLNHCWSAIERSTDAPEEYLAFAFLQPYAEFVRSRVPLHLEGYTHPLCPFCNRKPVLGILRQQGDGGRRSLLCGFCLTEWEFRRMVCPACGEENNTKLPVYTAESFPYIRVECCDACHSYIKSIDLTKNGLAVPLVDELASLPLDLWAEEHGYEKLHPNLFGM
jgi:FdhE protein